MKLVYFKTDTSGPVRIACIPDRKIDFSDLGQEFELDPASIRLNGTRFPRAGLQSAFTWEQIEEALKLDGISVGTKEHPVLVTGTAAVLEVSTEGEPSPKKRKGSPAVSIPDSETGITDECRYVEDLLAPPDDLPVEVADLHGFLSDTSGPLPVSFPRFVSVRDTKLVKLSSRAELLVAEFVGIAITTFEEHPDNEAASSCKLQLVTGQFLLYLNSLASSKQSLQSLRMTMDSSRNPGTVPTATASVRLKRPDFSLYIRNALILRWENEFDPAGFETALKENTEKLKVWSYLYYGTLPYVIGGCCGG